jgi:tRNA uridine 5-carboxymethylaminomethyl modification enzyme
MLPSRCEHRLVMRHDNADERLCPIGRELGLIDDSKWGIFNKNRASMASAREKLARTRVRASEGVNAVLAELGSSPIAESVTAVELLKRPEISWSALSRIIDIEIDGELGRKIEIDAKYEGYAEREFRRVRRMTSMERLAIPEDMVYSVITGLSAESAEKLSRVLPRTLGQASRVPGVNNVDIQLLQVAIEKKRGEARYS